MAHDVYNRFRNYHVFNSADPCTYGLYKEQAYAKKDLHPYQT